MTGPAETRALAREIEEDEPRLMSDEEIAAAVADDPDAAPILAEGELEAMLARQDALDAYGVARLRRRLGLAQVQFVNRYKVPYRLLREWELGVSEPEPAWRLLLAVIAEEPERVAADRALTELKAHAEGLLWPSSDV